MAGKKVTKADLISSIYQKEGVSRKDIRIVVECFLDEIKNSLIQNQLIELRGFGTFEIRIRKGRKKARSPKSGEHISVNSHGVAAFRPGKELKRDVWHIGLHKEVAEKIE